MHYGPETFPVRMPDAAMEPRIAVDAYAYADPDEPAEPGRLVSIVDPETGAATVRLMELRDGVRVLRALSPGWPDIALDRDNETMITGTVVFVRRRSERGNARRRALRPCARRAPRPVTTRGSSHDVASPSRRTGRRARIAVVTGRKIGPQASGGGRSAKNIVGAGVMTGC